MWEKGERRKERTNRSGGLLHVVLLPVLFLLLLSESLLSSYETNSWVASHKANSKSIVMVDLPFWVVTLIFQGMVLVSLKWHRVTLDVMEYLALFPNCHYPRVDLLLVVVVHASTTTLARVDPQRLFFQGQHGRWASRESESSSDDLETLVTPKWDFHHTICCCSLRSKFRLAYDDIGVKTKNSRGLPLGSH